jgi:hypothetical protein
VTARDVAVCHEHGLTFSKNGDGIFHCPACYIEAQVLELRAELDRVRVVELERLRAEVKRLRADLELAREKRQEENRNE